MNQYIQNSLVFAKDAHKYQVDKGGSPYIEHCIAVYEIANNSYMKYLFESMNLDYDLVLISALLHDTVEDTKVSLNEIEQVFGLDVANIVDNLTKRENETFDQYFERVESCVYSTMVKICDLKNNTDLTRIENPTKRDISRTKYYKSLIRKLNNTLMEFIHENH